MKHSRGFSLSTKFILFAAVLEIILISGGLLTAHSYLIAQRTQLVGKYLQSQVDWIAESFRADSPDDWKKLSLDRQFHFQVLDRGGLVLSDRSHPDRKGRSIIGQHALWNQSRQHPSHSGVIETPLEQKQDWIIGAFRKSSGPDGVVILGAVSKAEVLIHEYRILEQFLALGLLFAGLSFLGIVLFSLRIIRPIRQLTSAARELSNGNFDVELSVSDRDEIGVLNESFALMAMRVQELLKEEIQKIRIEKEVHSVADIQQSLLPKSTVHSERFWIEGFYRSATETGGDYWGYFETPRYLVTYIADATGHGLPSAMLTSAAKGAFSAIHRFALENPQMSLFPSQLLRLANEAVVDSAHLELNMTMFIAIYDFDLQKMLYANAGHYQGWMIRRTGTESAPQVTIESLKGTGQRLGESKDFVSPEDREAPWSDHDILFLYSDGLVDCTNPDGAALSKGAIKLAIDHAALERMDPEKIKKTIVERVDQHTQGLPLKDDITFALVKRK